MTSIALFWVLLALYAPRLASGSCPVLQAPEHGSISCDQGSSAGRVPDGTRCTYNCGHGYTIGSIWSWSHQAGDSSYEGTISDTSFTGDHPQLYEQFKASPDTPGIYRAGPRTKMSDVISRVCSGEWSGQNPRCWSTQQHLGCVSGVFPKCSSRTSRISPETLVTIIGANFSSKMSVVFNDANVQKFGAMRVVEPTKIIVAVPPYIEHNDVPYPYGTYDARNQIPYNGHAQLNRKSTKGTVVVMADGIPLQDCRDQDTGHARRVFEFSFTVGWPANPPLYATDYKNNRIMQIDPDTGISTTLIDAVEGFELQRPYGLDIGPDGALYVGAAGPSHGRILRYNVTGQFLGVWANVPGEPRGLRWQGDRLFVASWHSNRVISYRHNLARVNFDNPMGMQNIVGSYSGPFTQDMTHVTPSHNEAHFQRGIPNGVKLTHPWELRFHVLLSSLKLFVSSADNGYIFQFNGINGLYERVLTQAPVKFATGFGFGFSKQTTDLYAVGMYSGGAISRFNSTSGEFMERYRDKSLKRTGGLVTHDNSMYVSSQDEIRQYSLTDGQLIRISTKIHGAELGFVTVAAQCN